MALELLCCVAMMYSFLFYNNIHFQCIKSVGFGENSSLLSEDQTGQNGRKAVDNHFWTWANTKWVRLGRFLHRQQRLGKEM